MERRLKSARWIGSSQRAVRSFPAEVRKEVGYAIYTAQKGDTDPAAKPMKGFPGASVMEIVVPFDGDTWRTVYTIRL